MWRPADWLVNNTYALGERFANRMLQRVGYLQYWLPGKSVVLYLNTGPAHAHAPHLALIYVIVS